MELTINTVLHNKYRIISILGSGGFGITYLAEHELLGQKVAIKEFFMDGCVRADAGDISYQSTKTDLFVDFKARFKTEAQTLAKFKHPSIVRVTDIFEENGTSYFVMDCIEGQTLKEWVQQNGAMPLKMATNYLKQIIGALEEVHAKDMLHRDIKPDNIMISNNGTAVLIDFGAARNFISEHTQTNTGIYTPGYAPKEQYASGKLDARTDIYGLCATFYYTLTAQKPIDAISRFPDDSLASLSQIDSYIPEWLSQLIMKGLSPDMKNRFSSVAEMHAAIGSEKTTTVNADKTSIAHKETPKDEGKTTVNQSDKTQFVTEEKTQFNIIDKTTIHQSDKIELVKPFGYSGGMLGVAVDLIKTEAFVARSEEEENIEKLKNIRLQNLNKYIKNEEKYYKESGKVGMFYSSLLWSPFVMLLLAFLYDYFFYGTKMMNFIGFFVFPIVQVVVIYPSLRIIKIRNSNTIGIWGFYNALILGGYFIWTNYNAYQSPLPYHEYGSAFCLGVLFTAITTIAFSVTIPKDFIFSEINNEYFDSKKYKVNNLVINNMELISSAIESGDFMILQDIILKPNTVQYIVSQNGYTEFELFTSVNDTPYLSITTKFLNKEKEIKFIKIDQNTADIITANLEIT